MPFLGIGVHFLLSRNSIPGKIMSVSLSNSPGFGSVFLSLGVMSFCKLVMSGLIFL